MSVSRRVMPGSKEGYPGDGRITNILSIPYPVPLAPPKGTGLLTKRGLLTRDSESFISKSRDPERYHDGSSRGAGFR
jgi:hypothetical protein